MQTGKNNFRRNPNGEVAGLFSRGLDGPGGMTPQQKLALAAWPLLLAGSKNGGITARPALYCTAIFKNRPRPTSWPGSSSHHRN
jgi:hypothetical protein